MMVRIAWVREHRLHTVAGSIEWTVQSTLMFTCTGTSWSFLQVRATETFKTPGVRGEEGGQCSSARGDISGWGPVVAPTPPLSEFSSISLSPPPQVKGGSGRRPRGASTPPSHSPRTTASRTRCRPTPRFVDTRTRRRSFLLSGCSLHHPNPPSPLGGAAPRGDGRLGLHLDQPQRPAAAAGAQSRRGGEHFW